MSRTTMAARSQDTLKTLLANKQSYEGTVSRIEAGLFIRKEAAMTDAELEAFKENVAQSTVVQNIWGGNIEEAISDISSDIDLEDGTGRFSKTLGPELSDFATDSTSVDFKVVDSAVSASDISAYRSYDTRELATYLLGSPESNPNVEALNEELEKLHGEDGFSLQDTLALLAAHNLIVNEDYLGSGYIGPYAGSTEFSGNDGFEYVELTEGCLVRIGSGYSNMDTEPWEYFSSSELDSFLLTITQSSDEQAGDILMGGSSSGNSSSDLNEAADQLTKLVQLAQVLADPDNVPSEAYSEDIANQDRKYREEQGQQNLFPESK